MIVILLALTGCKSERKTALGTDVVVETEAHVSEGGPVTTSARRGTKPAIAQIQFDPKEVTARDHVRVVVRTTEVDGDVLDLDYQWKKNGQMMGSETSQDFHGSVMRGDTLSCIVTATDKDGSIHKEAGPIIVANSKPQITTNVANVTRIDGLRMQAKDPDGDDITWRLSNSPYGMTIGDDDGTIHYKGSENEQGGSFRVTVIADDGHNGTATWEFAANVSAGSQATSNTTASTANPTKTASANVGARTGRAVPEAQDLGSKTGRPVPEAKDVGVDLGEDPG